DDASVLVGEGASLWSALASDAPGFVRTGVLAAPVQDPERVALRFDAEGDVAVQVRSSADGAASWSDWAAAEITFHDGLAHNAQLDLPPGVTHVQLRFQAGSAEVLRHLVVDVFRLPRAADDGTGESSSALASDGVAVPRAQWG